MKVEKRNLVLIAENRRTSLQKKMKFISVLQCVSMHIVKNLEDPKSSEEDIINGSL